MLAFSKKILILAFLLTILVVKTEAADLIFVEDNSFSENGYKYVQGIIKNNGNRTIKIITITVKFYNKDGKFLRFAQCFANPVYLLPEHEGFYSVCVPDDQQIRGYSVHADYDLE